jgi:hypothetical protein
LLTDGVSVQEGESQGQTKDPSEGLRGESGSRHFACVLISREFEVLFLGRRIQEGVDGMRESFWSNSKV